MIGASTLFNFSCKKSPDTIGNELQPESNYIGAYFTDTTSIECYSTFVDSMGTTSVTYALLGSMMDPVFGRTNAGFYTQLHLSSSGQQFGENAVLDSVVLQLNLSGYYGDTTTLQTVHVYEMSDSLSSSETYYSFSIIPTETEDFANGYQFKPKPNTTGYVIGSDTLKKPVIRIPLSASFGNKLLTAGDDAYSEPDNFKEFLKGLYVTCESVSAGGSVSYITLTNHDYTLLQLYYHESPEATTTSRYDFYVTSADKYFNHFDHNYTLGSEAFVNQVVNGDTTLGAQVLYLQATGGVRTFLRFPNVLHLGGDSLEDYQHVVINQAKLIIPASEVAGDTSIYGHPSALVLYGINEDGSTYLLPDYYEGSSYYGGSYSSKTNSVTFRISEYLQNLIQGDKPNKGIYVAINAGAYNANRWIVAGPNSGGSKRLKLEITYSIVGE